MFWMVDEICPQADLHPEARYNRYLIYMEKRGHLTMGFCGFNNKHLHHFLQARVQDRVQVRSAFWVWLEYYYGYGLNMEWSGEYFKYGLVNPSLCLLEHIYGIIVCHEDVLVE